jgi:hypothetical protein
MLRWWWRLAAVLCIASISFIALIRAQPLSALPASLLLQNSCEFPCWQGIQPRITSSSQAVDILNHHPWVGRVWGVSSARWTWSGQQPAWIDSRRLGTMSIRYGVVDQISIPTRFSTGDFWLLLTRLEKGVVFTSGLSTMAYNFVDAGDFWIVSDLSCPITRHDFWQKPVLILLGDMAEFERQHAHIDYAMSGWARGVSC